MLEARPPKSSGNKGKNAPLIFKTEFKGKWHDILVHAKWSRSADGFFRVYVNHSQRFNYSGQTIASGRAGDFKFGIYRSHISDYRNHAGAAAPKQVVYYDEIHQGATLKAVDRAGVADIQKFLSEKGLYSGAIDGLWGSNTLQAVNDWRDADQRKPVAAYSVSLWNDYFGKRLGKNE